MFDAVTLMKWLFCSQFRPVKGPSRVADRGLCCVDHILLIEIKEIVLVGASQPNEVILSAPQDFHLSAVARTVFDR